MSLSLGQRLKIRSMIYVAGEPIAYFWPMRSFIHHNPLHGFEQRVFEDAVEEGRHLFHARGYLSRGEYQTYLQEGKVDRDELRAGIDAFLANRPAIADIDLGRWLLALLTETRRHVALDRRLAQIHDVTAALAGKPPNGDRTVDLEAIATRLRETLLGDRPVYESIDCLFGTSIGSDLDELMVKSCLDFFDEGQSVWGMPGRERGFFRAWSQVARRNLRLFLRGIHVKAILAADDSPEGVIAHVMHALQIPEDRWVGYFTREIARLHGWAGFIRWRSTTGNYYWGQRYPGDLVDFVAVRLTLALALLSECSRRRISVGRTALQQAIASRTAEVYLRHELHTAAVLPTMARRVEVALANRPQGDVTEVFSDYVREKRVDEANRQASCLLEFARKLGDEGVLLGLTPEAIGRLLDTLVVFERNEGPIWLRAMESHAIKRLRTAVNLEPSPPRAKRPFVQALFCIDTRSERIRRHLEAVGDYQTYGIAGFFGVPVSFIQLGKGSEKQLCPVILTPKNLVLEMAMGEWLGDATLSALGKAMHGLKESVLTPFVTVEAIGMLFGFDMIGKTVAPQRYTRWRRRLDPQTPSTRLLLDKLSREQADSIVRAVQRAVIEKAVEHGLGLSSERITDDMIRALREAAMGNQPAAPEEVIEALGLDNASWSSFLAELREGYRINPAFAQQQLERLARIGFSLDEQVGYVSQALRSIGLIKDFSRFVLLVGHGSLSENNPYESALDCGACGGNHGVVSARVLAQMANKPVVRRRLRSQGLDIADDAWFIPAMHNTTTDELKLLDLDLLPPSHLVYLDRLRNGLISASRRCAHERLPTLDAARTKREPVAAYRKMQRYAMDWSQVRPEWGLSGNAYFIIGRRSLTQGLGLDGRAFLHSYDYRADPKRRLLENILTGPLVVGQWINMEHYFSTVDNDRFGSGSKVYHNVAGRFGVMTGNLSDLKTGLPAQTVLKGGRPYHQPIRLITVIDAPLEHARHAVEGVVTVKNLVHHGWIRMMVIDPETKKVSLFDNGDWQVQDAVSEGAQAIHEESSTV